MTRTDPTSRTANPDAEKALVGSLLIAPHRMAEVARVVESSHFADGFYRAVYATCLVMHEAGRPIEPIGVLREVKQRPEACLVERDAEFLGDAGAFAARIMGDLPTGAHAVHYAAMVASAALHRQLYAATNDLQAAATDDERGAVTERIVGLSRQIGMIEETTRPFTTLHAECVAYLESLGRGERQLVDLGLPDLDYALGGGAAFGELVVLAARPGNGKTMCAMQIVENLALQGYPGLIVSEEMSAQLLASRSLGHTTPMHRDAWERNVEQMQDNVERYFQARQQILIAEPCGTVDAAVRQIERAVAEGVRVVAVDYAQLLKAKGRDRYEQVTNTSIALRQVCKRYGVLMLMLCQLSRADRNRGKYIEPETKQERGVIPVESDLRDSGQIEQDADVIVFLQWPLKANPRYKPYDRFFMYVAKNRNRVTNQQEIACRVVASRQMLVSANYCDALSEYESSGSGEWTGQETELDY